MRPIETVRTRTWEGAYTSRNGPGAPRINSRRKASGAIRWQRDRFWYDRAMGPWVAVLSAVLAAAVSALIAYLITRLKMEKSASEQARRLAEVIAALENEKRNSEENAKAIEEGARRKALDEFLADMRVEERRYVREHRMLFAHRKSLVVQERIFFRNIPLSNWVEHEALLQEGADLDEVAKTLSVFGGTSLEPPRQGDWRKLPF